MAQTGNVMNKLIFTLKALADDINIRSTHGTLILVLDDANVSGQHTYKKLKKVTDGWEDKNKEYIKRAFVDYGVKKIMVFSGHEDGGIADSLGGILKSMDRVYENGWVVAPQIENESEKKILCDWIKTQRRDEDYPIKGVVYNYKADCEAIVNFTGSNFGDGITTTSDEYCVDVASYLCVLGSNEGITSHVAKNVTDCDVKDDNDDCVGNGELFLYNDGTDIVYSRGVNSLTTIPADQSEYLTKIRVIEIIDLIKSDLRLSFKKNYLGRYGNSYKNRKTLVNVVNSYLKTVQKQGYLSNDKDSFCELDVEATRNYLETVRMVDCDDMDDNEILKHPIDTHVFLKITLYVMDVVEDVQISLLYTE